MKNFFVRKPALALVCVSVLLFILISVLAAPGLVALAQSGGQPPPPPPGGAPPGGGGNPGNSLTNPPQSNINSIDDVFERIKDLFNIFFWLLIVLAAIFIIWAAFIYLTASGEPEKIKKANRMVTYAVVAVVVATLARAIPAVTCSFITTNSSCEVDSVTGIPGAVTPR